MSSRKQAKKK